MAKLYAVSEEELQAIGNAIRTKRDITTPIEVENMPLEISLIDGGGGVQIPGRIIDITGACEIYIGDLADRGFAVRIDNDFPKDQSRPCFFSWYSSLATGSVQVTIFNPTSRPTTGSYASYFGYNADTKTITYNGSTSQSYNLRGKWALIPVDKES